MTIKPILFNTEEVRATLDGRKTVTRRVANPWAWVIEFERCEKPEMFDNTQ